MEKEWVTVTEYAKRKGIKNPQTIYGQINTGRFKGKWREIKREVRLKQVLYEEGKK